MFLSPLIVKPMICHYQTMILVKFSIPKNIIETPPRDCINYDLDQRNSSQERVRKRLFSAYSTLKESQAKVDVMPRQVFPVNFNTHNVCQAVVEVREK